MKTSIYSNEFAELTAETANITGTVTLNILEQKTKLKITSLSVPKEALPELIKYLQGRIKMIDNHHPETEPDYGR